MMLNSNRKELIAKYILYLTAIFVFVSIALPLIKPVAEAANIEIDDLDLYESVLAKSFPDIKVSEDENREKNESNKNIASIIFKYLTNVDIKDPKTYIASQIPILNAIDTTSLLALEDGPVVVKPQIQDDNTKNQNNPQNNVNNNDTNNTPKNVDSSKPLVLIFHTHATECYNPDDLQDSNKNFSIDSSMNMCRVGEELKNELQNKYGISCLHDMTYHDLPKREGGYEKAKPTIEKYLKQYPGLKIMIDLHRDGDVPKNTATAIINNTNYARVMFVIGKNNKAYKKNESLAFNINNILDKYYPKFSRGFDYQAARYNQDLSEKLVLLEVGSNTNTLQEAINSSKIIARAVSECVK